MNKTSLLFSLTLLLGSVLWSHAFGELPVLTEEQKVEINKEARKVQKTDGAPRWDNPEYPFHWRANGCGPNKWFSLLIPDGPYPKSKLWVDVCNTHDRAYMTLAADTIDARRKADHKLYTGMANACGSDSTCKIVAAAFYVPISSWPQENFEESQKEQRDYEDWVHKYLGKNSLSSNNK